MNSITELFIRKEKWRKSNDEPCLVEECPYYHETYEPLHCALDRKKTRRCGYRKEGRL